MKEWYLLQIWYRSFWVIDQMILKSFKMAAKFWLRRLKKCQILEIFYVTVAHY